MQRGERYTAVMSRPQAVIFFVVAFLVLLVVVLLPRPWNDVASFLVMTSVFVFATVQERRTGVSAGLVKWLALGLAVFDLYQLVTFFNRG